MSSVFLSNVDDYLGPSQACVNPLFTGSAATTDKTTDETPKAVGGNAASENGSVGVIIPRTRRRRAPPPADGTAAAAVVPLEPKKEAVVKASIIDCLACSGCVTTAETVLLEERHSLQVLKDLILQQQQQQQLQQQQNNDSTTIVMTISPASWADLLRIVWNNNTNSDDSRPPTPPTILDCQRKLTTLFHEILQVSVVLDGNVPLEWSRNEAAEEFCRAWRRAHPRTCTNGDDTNDISSLSSSSPLLPLLSSSCPASVCLVEKSVHTAVPHLATTKSPMSVAGAFWRHYYHHDHQQQQDTNDHQHQKYFHLAVMPCHDKKLEASRTEFLQPNDPTTPDVNMSITTQECWELIQELFGSHHPQNESLQLNGGTTSESTTAEEVNVDTSSSNGMLSSYLENLAMAPVYDNMDAWVTLQRDNNNNKDPCALITSKEATPTALTAMAPVSSSTTTTTATTTTSFHSHSSGGYADFIFRYAAQKLFDVPVSGESIWTPVSMDPRKQQGAVSARVAARREFYQAVLYRHANGSYSTSPTNGSDQPPATPVLSFAIANGMQTIQRALQYFQQQQQGLENGTGSTIKTAASTPSTPYFDYIEIMACPSGCLNGGGQIRSTIRETPTETRHRIRQSQQLMAVSKTTSSLASPTSIIPSQDMHTTYRVIAPLQLVMGAAAGVAVKDTHW